MKSVMRYIKEVDDRIQMYCDECGMIHELPKTHLSKNALVPYYECGCGNTGKLLAGKKDDNGLNKALIILLAGVVVTILMFLWSSVAGWISLVIFAIATIGAFTEGHDAYAPKKGASLDKFNSHKSKLTNPDKYLLAQDLQTAICIDSDEKNVSIMYSDLEVGKVLSFKDIYSVEIVEDGNTMIKTSRSSQLGGALVGAAVAGGVGAVIGGLSGKKTQINRVCRIDLKLTLNDVECPVLMINIMNELNFSTKSMNKDGESKDSQKYKRAKEKATYWHGLISVLVKREENHLKEVDGGDSPSNNSTDELMKLVSLHKEGYLTTEEFERQKRKLI